MSENSDGETSRNDYVLDKPNKRKYLDSDSEKENNALVKENEFLRNQIQYLQSVIHELKDKMQNKEQMNADTINNIESERITDDCSNNKLETNNHEVDTDLYKTIKNKNKKHKKESQDRQNMPLTSKSMTTKTQQIHTEDNKNITDKLNNKSALKQKPPPINILYQNVTDTIKIIREAKITDTEIKKIRGNKHVVYTNSITSYNRLMEDLGKAGTELYTYTIKENKAKQMVMKGLSENENIGEILQELNERYYSEKLKFIKVIQMESTVSKQKRKKLPLYIVQITSDSELRELAKIKIINYQRIIWEPLQRQKIIQCYNCQRYGHVSINCRMEYRCVKCNKQHAPGQCLMEKNTSSRDTEMESVIKENTFCINCKQEGHPASYKGCPIYKSLIEKMKNKKTEITNKKKSTEQFNSLYQNGISFADLFHTATRDKGNLQNTNEQTNLNYKKNINNKINNIDLEVFKNYITENDKKMDKIMEILTIITNKKVSLI